MNRLKNGLEKIDNIRLRVLTEISLLSIQIRTLNAKSTVAKIEAVSKLDRDFDHLMTWVIFKIFVIQEFKVF